MEHTTKQGLWRSGLALILALTYDWIFYQKGLGINFPIFSVLALVGFTLLSTKTKELRNKFAWWLTLPFLALSVAPALYTNTYASTAAPILAILTLMWFMLIVTVDLKGVGLYLSELAFPKHLDALVTNWRPVYTDAFAWREGQAKKVVWGIVISFPLLIIFATLLASADQIFAEWLKNLNIWEGIWRVFRTVMFTLFTAAWLYLLGSDKNTMSERIQKVFKMEPVTVGIVLALLNSLFGLFVFIQIKYLFGGTDFVLTNNVSFAEYARSGFFELVRVLLLAAVIIILVHRSFAHHGRHPVINVFQGLFIAQIGVVAYSALYRMNIYQEAFGFTSLRLYVEWFIYALFAMLLWSGVALVANVAFRKFFLTGASLVLSVAAVVSLVNVDYLIARENIQRFLNEGKTLDVNYLSGLSQDTVPAWEVIGTNKENFSKLSISQQLQLDETLQRYNRENASSTTLGYTWSERQSAHLIPIMYQTITEPLSAARAKDKWYENTRQNLLNNEVSNYTNCWFLDTDPIVGVKSGDLRPMPATDLNVNFNVNCITLPNDPSVQAQITMTEKYDSTDYAKSTRTYTYRQVNLVAGQPAKVIYQKEFSTEFFSDSDSAMRYSLQKNGNPVEFDFNNREIYLYPFSNNSDKSKVTKESLYVNV